MTNRKPINTILSLLMILINVALSILIIFLMRHVQELLNSDVRINLKEIVTQNKDAITSRLMMNLNSLHLLASKVSDSMTGAQAQDIEHARHTLNRLAVEERGAKLYLADGDGVVYFPNGKRIDVVGRSYYRLAITGVANISDKLVSRYDGKEVYIISVPLYYKDTIVGTIQKAILQDEMYSLCALSLFSAQGNIYMVNSDGYTILHSTHEFCAQSSDNYFRDLFASGNPEASRKIQEDISHKRDGFIEATMGGQKSFSAYTAIDKIHDWYLITSVPTDVVSPNAKTVIDLFFIILFVIVFIFSSSIIYFLWYKNVQRANLEKIAFVDPVTRGDTYAKFTVDAAATLMQYSDTNFHILKFDIDNFKYINSFYGFEFGDRILGDISARIRAQLSEKERLARISGDHFVALLEDASVHRLTAILASLESDEAVLYFSAGVYTIADRSLSVALMVDRATAAAQSVKSVLKKHISYYSEEFEKKAVRNEELKRSVRQAIDRSEFVPFFQPKMDIDTLIPVGGEALVRWKTPDGVYISPGEFLPMCEQTGIITEIDLMVYEKVLAFLSKRLELGLPCVPISVNFSRLHLLDEEFFDKITSRLQKYQVPPYLIEFELTESAIFDNMEQIEAFTRQTHAHGFLLGMDDFGSGYSSLNMLKDIPIDVLKIDKGFLSDGVDNARRNIIFASIVTMANKLDIKIVVEGVEFVENVDLMRACGCRIAQGYYFARPMEESCFDAFLDNCNRASGVPA